MRHLKIESLSPTFKNWIDKDIIMLHACFQLLKDFVEKEKGDTHYNYDVHKELVDEIRFLYNWWMQRKNVESIDNAQMQEDDKMLIRLMTIRTSLWT